MENQIRELVDRAMSYEADAVKKWLTWRFWQELFVYYWVFALVGHYLEVVWGYLLHLITGWPLWQPITSLTIPLSAPYGLGTVFVILFVWPLVKNRRFHPIIIFLLNVIITAMAEYICAWILVMAVDYNQYWDYSNRFMNINGYTCLEAGLIFGIVATFFVYYVYPFCENILRRVKSYQLSFMFWILLVSYILDWICSSL